MKRLILLLLLPALLLLGGCMPYVRQTPEEETTLITVGFSQGGAESDWRVANTESMRESLGEENGFELLFDNARQKQDHQFKAIRTFIQQDVDYIVLAPVTETGWESVLEAARAAGEEVEQPRLIVADRLLEAVFVDPRHELVLVRKVPVERAPVDLRGRAQIGHGDVREVAPEHELLETLGEHFFRCGFAHGGRPLPMLLPPV